MDGARRTLWLLAAWHLGIAVATMPIALLAIRGLVDTPAASPSIGPVAGALFLGAAQVLSCWRTSALARAATDHIAVADMARSLRRAEWSFAFTVIPAGVLWVLLSAETPVPRLSALFALLAAAVLVEGVGIDWHHRRAPRLGQYRAAPVHQLPMGTGLRTRAVQARIIGTHAFLGGIAAILLVATVVAVSGSGTVTLTASAQIVAAIAATAVPLLPIRGLLRVRSAIAGDTVHEPALGGAMASLRRSGVAAVLLTAGAIASLWAPPIDPDLAAGLCSLAVVAAGIAVSPVIELERFRIGDIPRRFRPKG